MPNLSSLSVLALLSLIVRVLAQTGPTPDCPSHLSANHPLWDTLEAVHARLSTCANISALSIRIASAGCASHPDRWSLPLDPWGRTRYPSAPRSLSLNGYAFSDTELRYVRPPSLDSWDYYLGWITSGKAWAWLQLMTLLSPEQRAKTNLELWVDAMNFSFVEELSIYNFHFNDGKSPELLIKHLLPRVPNLRSLSVDDTHLKELILAMPRNSLQHLTYLDPRPSQNLDPILQTHAESLISLDWWNREGGGSWNADNSWSPRPRPLLSTAQLRNLSTAAPNLVSLALDLERKDDDWPWDRLEALRAGLPRKLENLTLRFEMASACRRQNPFNIHGENPCSEAGEYAQPLLTKEHAREMTRFLMGGGNDQEQKRPRALSRVAFVAGEKDEGKGSIMALPYWLYGKHADINCTISEEEAVELG
ncbi:hypothetical protein PG984_012303 [Apiospora sp. TS-2023a]